MKLKTTLVVALATLTALTVQAEKYVIKGSDTLGAKMIPQIAELYKKKNPDTTFEIAAEGSTTGVAAIIDGTADIGMSSRAAKDKELATAAEKNVTLTPTTVAYDGIAIIVNEKNPISEITLKQVEQIFTGDIRDWSALGGKPGQISAYTRNTSSGTYGSFNQLAMSKRDYAEYCQKMAGNEQIAQEVGKNPNGVGYVGLAYIGAEGIKVIPVDGAMPTIKSVNDKSYSIARPMYVYTNGEPTGKAKKFIDFATSPEGQKIVETVGFVPLLE